MNEITEEEANLLRAEIRIWTPQKEYQINKEHIRELIRQKISKIRAKNETNINK